MLRAFDEAGYPLLVGGRVAGDGEIVDIYGDEDSCDVGEIAGFVDIEWPGSRFGSYPLWLVHGGVGIAFDVAACNGTCNPLQSRPGRIESGVTG